MNYFTSDIHFCDITTLKADCRPFKSINQFDKYIIKLWNKTAKKNDTIYVVGDLLDCDGPNHFSWHKALKYIKKIKANIVLIMGNNEQRILDNYFDCFKSGDVSPNSHFEIVCLATPTFSASSS